MHSISKRLSGALAAAMLGLAAQACVQAESARELPELGLMGSIPVFWGEVDDIGGLLGGEAEPHWARVQLERSYRLRPLDTLDTESLAGLDMLLLAQPRALSPAENVALDAWVRGGGRLLLFADPMLTGDSRFPIGDRRRPHDVILLSPLLGHWGLTLEFDSDGSPGARLVEGGGAPIPVDLPGRFTVADDGPCTLAAEAALARCTIGAGRALILADAALLDLHHPHPGAHAALEHLMSEGFGSNGEIAG